MVPFEPEALPNLSDARIFIAVGELDHMVPKENTGRLVKLLRDSGAEVKLRWQRTGHGLTREEVEEAKRWLSQAVYDETAGMW
jgi:phospholipase/carboxylesterase